MNNNADIDFLRFLARERFNMTLVDALSVLNEARRLYAPAAAHSRDEGVFWRGIYFSPEADDYLREGRVVAAIKAVRDDNYKPLTPGPYGYNYSEFGTLSLKDTKDVCEARREFLRG